MPRKHENDGRPRLRLFLTTAGGERFAKLRPIRFTDENAWRENDLICLYPEESFQTFLGIGGAFTESAALTLLKTGPARRRAAIRALFDPEKGAGFTIGRVHINSCDFSLGNWACDETPGDMALENFSISRYESAILPLVRDAAAAAGRPIRLLASPWSPPAWMKSNGEMNNGGTLRPECRAAWALHYAKFCKAFAEAGVPISAVSVQNEPKARQTWDSCLFTGEEERDFVRDHLGPTLEREGLGDLGVYVWDHNKERLYERAVAVLSDPAAARYVRGVAFPWYSGTHFDAVALVRRRYPQAKLILSEFCCSVHEGTAAAGWGQAEAYAQELIGDLEAGADALLDWNLVLDERGGPNHVGNYCAAPVRVDTRSGIVTYEPSYWALRHVGAFVRPGAVRIGSSHPYRNGVDVTAFRNEDGALALVMANRTARPLRPAVRFGGLLAPFELPPHAIVSGTIS